MSPGVNLLKYRTVSPHHRTQTWGLHQLKLPEQHSQTHVRLLIFRACAHRACAHFRATGCTWLPRGRGLAPLGQVGPDLLVPLATAVLLRCPEAQPARARRRKVPGACVRKRRATRPPGACGGRAGRDGNLFQFVPGSEKQIWLWVHIFGWCPLAKVAPKLSPGPQLTECWRSESTGEAQFWWQNLCI